MAAKFEVKRAENGKFMFNLKSANGEVILTSQTYANKAGALKGVAAVKKQARSEKNFDRKRAANGAPYFNLLAPNKQVVGKSELYNATSGARKGIASVMRNAGKARVVELA